MTDAAIPVVRGLKELFDFVSANMSDANSAPTLTLRYVRTNSFGPAAAFHFLKEEMQYCDSYWKLRRVTYAKEVSTLFFAPKLITEIL